MAVDWEGLLTELGLEMSRELGFEGDCEVEKRNSMAVPCCGEFDSREGTLFMRTSMSSSLCTVC